MEEDEIIRCAFCDTSEDEHCYSDHCESGNEDYDGEIDWDNIEMAKTTNYVPDPTYVPFTINPPPLLEEDKALYNYYYHNPNHRHVRRARPHVHDHDLVADASCSSVQDANMGSVMEKQDQAGLAQPEEEEEEEEEEPHDIDFVMTQAGVSKSKALEALKTHHGDIVRAIKDLTLTT